MDRGLYVAASGMLAEQARQQQITNDLANAATPGYKADRSAQRSFGELLLSNTATGGFVGAQATNVEIAEVRTNFAPAPIRETGEPLDMAIQGEGFFAVRTDQGVRYTRAGQFSVSPQGQLVTAAGDPVLGRNGQPIPVGADGRVDPRGLQVVLLQNPAKEGNGLVTGQPGGAGGGVVPGSVRAGAIEASGADAARSMVDMIASMRAFEAGQKVITTIDETLGQAARLGSISS